MTRVYDKPQAAGGVRVLALGAGTYPGARLGAERVPILADISSAGDSALRWVEQLIGPCAGTLVKPLASVDLLVNTPFAPAGATFTTPEAAAVVLEPPTLEAIKRARTDWLKGASANDVLIFYCCGHGIWLPSKGRTFLASDFGCDPEDPWPYAISLDDFALGLAEKPPRQQWLIFDCCANTPSPAMAALSTNPASLITPMVGGRGQAESAHGVLSQVIIASATADAPAYGRAGRLSRFTEALIEACTTSGYQAQRDDGLWWLDPSGLERAIGSYALRVADPADESYYIFPKVIMTDAADPPGLMRRNTPSVCTVLVMSDPQARLPQGDLAILLNNQVLWKQGAGVEASARFRKDLAPWLTYQINFEMGGNAASVTRVAQPPFVKTIFAQGGQ